MVPNDNDDWLVRHQAAELARAQLRKVDGKDYTEHLDEVDELIRRGDLDQAAGLLLRLVDAVEREHAVPLAGTPGMPPAYHRRLASVYRKLKRSDLAAQADLRYTEASAKAAAESNRLLLAMREQAMRSAANQPERSRDDIPRPSKAAITAGRAAGTAVRGMFRLGKSLARLAKKR